MEQRDEYGRVPEAEPVLAPALAKVMSQMSFPVVQSCRYCGMEIEDRGVVWQPVWVHLYSGGHLCRPTMQSPRAEPEDR